MEDLEAEAATGLSDEIGRGMEAPLVRVALTTATPPSAISVVFKPQSTSRTDPMDELQDKDLPAPVATGPAVTFRSVKSTGW